jgi:OOP family OmpA-OmpF porin
MIQRTQDRGILYASIALFALSGFAAALPEYFRLPAKGEVVTETVVEESFGEAAFPTTSDPVNVKRGRHFQAALRLPGGDDATHESLWAPFRTALTGAGWTVVSYFDVNPPSATLHYQKGGTDAWASITMFASNEIRMDLVEVKAFVPTLVLTPPTATVEAIGPNDAFPYLVPPKATLGSTDPDNGPLYVKLKGDEEPTLISAGSVRKDYARIDGMSNVQFVFEYRNAFVKAGWEIVQESQGLNQGDAVVIAHYVRGGRDIWASLHFSGELAITVADLSGDLAASLAKNCHLPLYGITFEFNKATLRPESESTLQRVVGALQGRAALNVEVQGHTDNVGDDAYNMQLSQARADAVRTWLASHGIAPARMTARGYGRNQPVADNATDGGRAKNRRVELAAAGCK